MSITRSAFRKKTDNSHLEWKEELRRMATEGLDSIRVLDLFAGNNTLWRNFGCERYYGVELSRGKGTRNVYADNLRIIPSLTLSRFNVVDCDAYGSFVKQLEALFANPTLAPGTVIVFTEIHPLIGEMPTELIPDSLKQMHSRAPPSLFNKYSRELFEGRLHRFGVESYTGYFVDGAYIKTYGFFTVPSKTAHV